MDPISIGILTVSDSCSSIAKADKSGPAVEQLLRGRTEFEHSKYTKWICSDDLNEIKDILVYIADVSAADIIFTTGGTGFSLRDNTPEATKAIIDREAPGLATAMITESLKITPLAMLSRLVCGIRNKTIIVNLPGSMKGSTECLQIILPVLSHAIDLVKNSSAKIQNTHKEIQMLPIKSKVDATAVANRDRVSLFEPVSVDDAHKLIMANSQVLGFETIDYTEGLDRILSEDVIAQCNLPPFRASIKDGYAVLSSDGSGNRHVMKAAAVAEKNELGDTALNCSPGWCVRISTGAKVPKGADSVVQVEDTRLVHAWDDGTSEIEIEILKQPRAGQDIREVGSDIAKDQLLLRANTRLGPSELGLLASVGCLKLQVFRKPIIALISSGDELVDPADESQSDCIRDCNKVVLKSIFAQNGFNAIDLGIAKDDPDSVFRKLREALSMADVIVSTGGVSMSEKDLFKKVLVTDCEAKIHFGRVFMKPGLPTTFATVANECTQRKTLAFALPGNPVSAFVTCSIFVLPACRAMSGFESPIGTTVIAKLGHEIKLDPRPEFHRAVIKWDKSEDLPVVSSTGNQISSRLLSCNEANCLLRLPPKSEDLLALPAGNTVEVLLIGRN